jgi:hypothetical protein
MKRPEMLTFARKIRPEAGRLFAVALLAVVAGCDNWRSYDDSNPDAYVSHWCDPRNLTQSPAFEGDGVVPHDLSRLPSNEECLADYYQRRDNEAKQ